MKNKNIIGIMALAVVIVMGACPAFAAQTTSATQQVQVTVNPTIAIAATWNSGANNSAINLGALDADGLQTPFAGGASGEQLYTYSNIPIDVYTRASGDLTSGKNIIALSNFLYKDSTGTNAQTAFTQTYAKIHGNWDAASQSGPKVDSVDLALTVPFGTAAGNYNSTVYFSAVSAGTTPAPSTP
jgi:hypothetical protein